MKRNIEAIERIRRIFDDWNYNGSINAIERAMVLRLLGELYEEVYFTSAAPAAEVAPQPVTPLADVPEPKAAAVESEPVSEPIAEQAPATEPTTEPEPEAKEEEEANEEANEEEEETIVIPKHRIDRKTILSIYDDSYDVAPKVETPEPIAEPEPEPTEEPEQEPIAEPSPIDDEPAPEPESEPEILPAPQTTEPIATPEEQPTEEQSHITVIGEAKHDDHVLVAEAVSSLRESIGLNDKFLLLADLFSNDNNLYNQTISTLDEFTSLDDALLYIHDNYRWNPNSEGAKLLVDLLARKLL